MVTSESPSTSNIQWVYQLHQQENMGNIQELILQEKLTLIAGLWKGSSIVQGVHAEVELSFLPLFLISVTPLAAFKLAKVALIFFTISQIQENTHGGHARAAVEMMKVLPSGSHPDQVIEALQSGTLLWIHLLQYYQVVTKIMKTK